MGFWPGRGLRARPPLFFVVEGGVGLVADLVEFGFRPQSREDADGCQHVDDVERPEHDPGVDLQPFLVESHPEENAEVLHNDLALAGPRRAFTAHVRSQSLKGLELHERPAHEAADQFQAQHQDDGGQVEVTHDGKHDHRNGYRELVAKRVDRLAGFGAAGVVEILLEDARGRFGVGIVFVFFIAGGCNTTIETVEHEAFNHDAESLEVESEEIDEVADPGDRDAPDTDPVGAQIAFPADANQHFVRDQQERNADEHSTDNEDDDLELAGQIFVFRHLSPSFSFPKNRVISATVHLFRVTSGRGYIMLEDAKKQGCFGYYDKVIILLDHIIDKKSSWCYNYKIVNNKIKTKTYDEIF